MNTFNTTVSFIYKNQFYEKHYDNPKYVIKQKLDNIGVTIIVNTVLRMIECEEGLCTLQNLSIKFNGEEIYTKEVYEIDYIPPLSNTEIKALYHI